MKSKICPAKPVSHAIGLIQAISLYAGAILGAGVLSLPGQAATLAGPASLLAWFFMIVLSLPLALTFMALALQQPGAGGVVQYATAAFRTNVGGPVGWLYLASGCIGQAVVPLTAGFYISNLVGPGAEAAYYAAIIVLLIAVVSNLAGLKASSVVQVVLTATIAAVLAGSFIFSLPHMALENLDPFSPGGLQSVGESVVILFFAFAGWEAITHLSGDFQDLKRDLPKATIATVILTGVLYFGAAVAVVLTGTYGSAEADVTSISLVLQKTIGPNAGVVAGALALVICIATTNAFLAALSRLVCALAGDGWLPHYLLLKNKQGTPYRAVLFVATIGGLVIAGTAIHGNGTPGLVAIASAMVVVVYLVSAAAGMKLLHGKQRWYAVITLAFTSVAALFTANWAMYSLGIVVCSLLYRKLHVEYIKRQA